MAQFYSDENFPRRVVEELRRLGHDVLTAREAGNANQRIPDDDVLKFAVNLKRIVLTINRKDFIRLHRQNPTHVGIIVCTDDSDRTAQALRIHQTVETNTELAGQLLRVNRPQR